MSVAAQLMVPFGIVVLAVILAVVLGVGVGAELVLRELGE